MRVIKNKKAKIIYPVDRTKLRLEVTIDKTQNLCSWKCLRDKKDNCWGEYIDFSLSTGNILYRGFNINDKQVGMWTRYHEDGKIEENYFFSFLTPGLDIDECEYKKELAMIRLGIIEVPALDILIKDYEK